MKVLLVLLVLGFATYLVVRSVQRAGLNGGRPGGRPAPRPGAGPGGTPRPVAPDDDPDFLRELDRKRRRRGEPDSS